MRAGSGGPIRLADVLEGVLEQAGVKAQVARHEALDVWNEVVGEHVAAVTRARGISESTLFVEVRTSAWLMELNMMKGAFLTRLNERLGTVDPLERIVFVLAETG